MKKRILAVMMTAAMVLGALTGCGQSSKDDKTESARAAETLRRAFNTPLMHIRSDISHINSP